MIMAFTIDFKSAMVFVVTIPLLSIVVFGIMFISMPLYKKVQKQLDRVLQMTRENLTGVRVVRAFNRQQDETAAYYKESGLLFNFQIFVAKISALLNPITYVIINLAIVVLIYVGSGQVNEGVIPQGELVALVNYMSQILVELIKLANLIITMTKAFACAGRINNVFETKSSIVENRAKKPEVPMNPAGTDQAGAPIPMVEFEHVSFAYKGAKAESLTDIDFRAMKGEDNRNYRRYRSRKKHRCELIPRFYDTTGGAVRINGTDVREYGLKGASRPYRRRTTAGGTF